MGAPGLVDEQRFSRRWQMPAIALMSAQVPYGVGLTISAPAASGWSCQACSTWRGEGGWARCSFSSYRGRIHRGCIPPKTSPATTDLCASRLTSRSPRPPATASMAALTDKELPQVEKKACSAPTASAISCSAADR